MQVAVPSPLHRLFDYRCAPTQRLLPGVRVTVPFGRRQVIGIVVAEVAQTDVPAAKLRAVATVHDDQPLLPPDLLKLLRWASRYYHHPLGDVLTTALPVLLRRGATAELACSEVYKLQSSVQQSVAGRAPVQQALLAALVQSSNHELDASALRLISKRWRASMSVLQTRGVVSVERRIAIPHNNAVEGGLELFDEQQLAVDSVCAALGTFKPFVLHGVTGSGKTEVYLRCIDAALAEGSQVLILVPEISLTPQLMQRFERRISGCLVALHSALNDSERMQSWLLAAKGHADVVIGTRSAVLVPMPRLGLIVIDEEHDSSLKQQDGFRYHARDVALMRARDRQCPVLLGTATPSFETLNNISRKRYCELLLSRRAGAAKPPQLALLDIRRRPLIEGLSDRLITAIGEHLDNAGQALIFINRRGFAPTLLCNDCGACADCKRCDAHMTVHAKQQRLRCHHCGAERVIPQVCNECGSANLDCVGYGTERIAAALETAFPGVQVARIDRDSTRRKGSLQKQLEAATSGEARLLVGTQMLAKGHHFPGVTLVGILDADRGLYGSDFRSLEQMGQLIVQVAGRAGRETRQGSVLVQTRNPDNPMLQTLISEGYAEFSRIALAERQDAHLPPYSYVALIRAEAADAGSPTHFLSEVAKRLGVQSAAGLYVMGPAPAPMERRGGRYRMQLLVQSDRRSDLNDCLSSLTTDIDSVPGIRKIRWSIDIDPVDFF